MCTVVKGSGFDESAETCKIMKSRVGFPIYQVFQTSGQRSDAWQSFSWSLRIWLEKFPALVCLYCLRGLPRTSWYSSSQLTAQVAHCLWLKWSKFSLIYHVEQGFYLLPDLGAVLLAARHHLSSVRHWPDRHRAPSTKPGNCASFYFASPHRSLCLDHSKADFPTDRRMNQIIWSPFLSFHLKTQPGCLKT